MPFTKTKLDNEAVKRLIALYVASSEKLLDKFDEATDFSRARRLALLAEVDKELKRLGVETQRWLDKEVPEAYAGGMRSALDGIKTMIEKEALGKDTLVSKALFTKPNKLQVAALIDDASKSFGESLTLVGRNVRSITTKAFQREVRAKVAEGIITGETRKQIVAGIKQELRSRGLTGLTDKAGRSWTIDRYAEMLARTKLVEARNTGLATKMLENKQDLVQVSINNSDHEACADWEGKILSLTGKTDGYDTVDAAEAAGLFHPNAVLSGTTFTPYSELNEMIGANYEGPAVVITTSENHTLTIGPNHPILTQRGLIKASSLNETDYLAYDTRVITSEFSRDSDFKHMPLVEDAFQSLLLADGSVTKVPTASHDFHGDRIFCKGEIEVVEPASSLLPILDSCGIEQFRDIGFMETNVQNIILSGDSPPSFSLDTINLPPPSAMSSALSGFKFLHITSLHNIRFKGKAFDAETQSGLYNSNGFVVSNCKHTINPIEPKLAKETYGWDKETGEYKQGIIE